MSDHNNQPLGFYADNPEWTSASAINEDLVARHEAKSKYFKPIILALGVGLILGIIGLILRLVDGVSDTFRYLKFSITSNYGSDTYVHGSEITLWGLDNVD